jgi:hypothetical protein
MPFVANNSKGWPQQVLYTVLELDVDFPPRDILYVMLSCRSVYGVYQKRKLVS